MNDKIAARSAGGRRRLVALAGALMMGSLGVALAAPAGADVPKDTGCPAGWDTLQVAELTALGYHVGEFVDQPGNNDGVVCGRVINDVRSDQICGGPCRVPILYSFTDNTVTRRSA